jgi:hypothetical protein
MKTLVIHPIDPTTDFLTGMYANQVDYKIEREPLKHPNLKQLISEYDRIIMLGHGLPGGLLEGFKQVIDDSYAEILKTKFCIGIWCYACEFFEKHQLTGYYSGMMISEVAEAQLFGIVASEEDIKVSNEKYVKAFSSAIEDPDFLGAFKSRYYPLATELYQFNWQRVFTNEQPSGGNHSLMSELQRSQGKLIEFLRNFSEDDELV